MRLPLARGPVTRGLFEHLAGPATSDTLRIELGDDHADVCSDDDLQLALWCCYELHYRGFDGVDEAWEWAPGLLTLRAQLEDLLLEELRTAVVPQSSPDSVPDRLTALVNADDGPQLSRFLERKADLNQYKEFVVHRSVYHLKEADPHSWAIPRLTGAPKAALMTIQADEYGSGSVRRMHSELFRSTMRGLGLSDSYGHYVDAVPGVTLTITNLISLFGLHRRWRGALLGHLAAFEMTSSLPNRRYSRGLRRLGGDESARRFYDEHVTADALHEQLAAHDLCGGLVAQEPALADDVVFGAACCLHLDGRFAEHLLSSWAAGRSSLRQLPAAAGVRAS